jgi:transcriptional regulatory protein RtcR
MQDGIGVALDGALSAEAWAALDPFDRVQLSYVLGVCRTCRSLSDAGRLLFAVSRQQRRSTNDADRLKKYLARFELSFATLRAAPRPLGNSEHVDDA